MTPSRIQLAALAAASLFAPVAAGQQLVFVDAAATGAENGASWADAFTDLQAALAVPGATEIWVAAGTYLPGPVGAELDTFELRSGVALFGGFVGGETSIGQRDVAANPTILSGDLDQNDTYGPSLNWWQFGWNNNAGNSRHIVTADGVDATAVLDGFTLLAGKGSGLDVIGGAGLLIQAASPTVRNCTFDKNAYGRGSAIFVDGGSPTLEGCLVRDGYTFGDRASGMYLQGGASPVVRDTTFDNHYAVATFGQGGGAAVYVGSGCDASFYDCTFTRNQTGNWFAQGDPSGAFGAGIYHYGNTLWVQDCVFTDNFCHAGAGIFNWSDATIINSLFARNRVVSYPITEVASSGGYGAGVASYASGSTTMVGCTVVANEAHEGGGITGGVANPVVLRNSVVWGNFSPPPLPGEDTLWILKQQISGEVDVAYSCVEALLLQEPGEDPPDPSDFLGCHDSDPLFVDLTGGDYRLASGSPCIDAGDNGAVPAGIVTDLVGAPRFFDEPTAPDVGLGAPPLVDMGPYEHGSPLASLVADVGTISVQVGGTQSLALAAGANHAGELYWVLGSLSGTQPGLTVDGVHLPLVPDAYLSLTLSSPNQGFLVGTLGTLDGLGRAAAQIVVPAVSGLAGLTAQHAFVALGGGVVTLASNAVALDLVP